MTDDPIDHLLTFVRDRLDEDDRAARNATRGPWHHEPDGPWEHQLTADDAELPVAYDMGNDNAAHIIRHNPARVLRQIEAMQQTVDEYERLRRDRARNEAASAELAAEIDHQEQTGEWAGPGLPDVRLRGIRRESDYLSAMEPALRRILYSVASIWSDHPDYQAKWRA
ncbi:hypothetical protein SAMN04487819_11683 [Actinopolyspora alba]|uniref:Uncharacterized protein n=1 Tax=Actinopolyspora alba TaxID=673379 RepID=A0A1I2BG39_9ACTN|nr:DUF6221 family protein [Actinopolyspora alba]SFE55019.1 hypothetical protein SAMN04487819_11683 [Actinopolyspora alba]